METTKRIGITTIAYDNTYNYGTRLQMYALQEFLRSRGFYVETMRYLPCYEKKYTTNKRKVFQRPIPQLLADVYRVLKRSVCHVKLKKLNHSRKIKFENFIRTHICLSQKLYESDSDFTDLANAFDCFITGSDQVWNPYWDGTNAFFYLPFIPKEKRISYAPSIATDHIPEIIREEFESRVKGIGYLSIREDVGKNLLKKEFGLDAKLVCDPVFLLPKQHWEAMASDPKIEGKYFVTYLLGQPDIQNEKKIKQLQRNVDMKRVDVYRWDNPNSVFAGPEEFIGWIRNAEFLVTDSFHGLAFSILMQTPVILVDRDSWRVDSMESRLESLLRMAGLENRGIDYILNDLQSINITAVLEHSALAELIENSKKYLMEAIDGCEIV